MALLPVVSLVNVSKFKGVYKKRHAIFENVSADFFAGERYAILGARESGKTTLLSILAGISRPSSGQVIRRGSVAVPVASTTNVASYRTGSKLAFLLARLYNADPGEMLAFATKFSGLPEHIIKSPIGTMNVEERVKLSIALGYATPADIYLFDGDIQYGDPDFRTRCRQAFEARAATAGTIVATSNPTRAAALATRGCVLHQGRLFPFDQIAEAIDMFHRVQLESKDTALTHVRTLVRMGEAWRAEDYLRDLVQQDTGSAEAYITLAELASRSGRHEEALTAAEAAVEKGATDLRMSLIIAQAREALGDASGAVEHLEIVVGQGRATPEIMMILARNLDKLNEPGRAGHVWKAAAISSNNAVAFRRAEMSFRKAEDWGALLEMADLGLRSRPDDVGLIEMRVTALIGARRWSEVEPLIETLCRIDALRAMNLIYGIVRTELWQEALPMLRAMPAEDIDEVRTARVSVLTVTTLRRHSAVKRRDGEIEIANAIDETIRLIVSE